MRKKKNKDVRMNTTDKTEFANKPDTAPTPNSFPVPVFPTKLRAKTEEFCNEFNTIQRLKIHKMTIKTKAIKDLLGAEINVRRNLLGIFRLQVKYLLDDACDEVNKELA